MSVRTVLGAITADQLGRVDTHEHLVIAGGPVVDADPDLRMVDVDDAVVELEAFAAAGGGAVIDALPTGCGRDPRLLRAIAERSRVHVVATSGFHRPRFYPERHWVRRYPVDDLVDVLLAEIQGGIDAYDEAGPRPDRTTVRPGVLKAASGYHSIDRDERRLMLAVARAQVRTGLPLLTHTEHGTAAERQLDLLEAEGVPPGRVMLGHLDRQPDSRQLLALAHRGCFLGFDGLGREKYRPYGAVAAVIREVVDAGFANCVLIGGDVGRRSMRLSAGSVGIVGVLTTMVPDLLAAGIPGPTVSSFFLENPRRFLDVADEQ